MTSKGPYRADHVGSLLRPPELLKMRERHAAREVSAAELRREEDKHIRQAVKKQEEVGLPAVTDGEFRRHIFHIDFLTQIDGVEEIPSEYEITFRGHDKEVQFAPPTLAVNGKLSHSKCIQCADFEFLAGAATATPKVTIPSPTMLHFRGGRGAIDEKAYPDLDRFFEDLAQVYRDEIAALAKLGCRYIQLDDTNLAYLCDPTHRERAKSIGEDPNKLPSLYARLISECLKDRPGDMTACIHLCRGNFRGAWAAEGSYDFVAEAMFNETDVDGFFLEYDDPRSGGFDPLRFVPKGKKVVLGLISSKVRELESADDVKARIEEAAKIMDIDQLCLSPQCGFSSEEHGNDPTPDEQWAKLKLTVDVARDVWGDVR